MIRHYVVSFIIKMVDAGRWDVRYLSELIRKMNNLRVTICGFKTRDKALVYAKQRNHSKC